MQEQNIVPILRPTNKFISRKMDHEKYLNNIELILEDNGNFHIEAQKEVLIGSTFLNGDSDEYQEKIINTLELMCKSKELLQIAEMYYDHMKSSGQSGSLAFEVTEKVLKELKTR